MSAVLSFGINDMLSQVIKKLSNNSEGRLNNAFTLPDSFWMWCGQKTIRLVPNSHPIWVAQSEAHIKSFTLIHAMTMSFPLQW